MSDRWDPGHYLTFAGERGRPFLDLVARIPGDATAVLDLGCGAGNLTPVLRGRWPGATVLGVDSSAEMIARAAEQDDDPRTAYVQADAATWTPETSFDVVVSNAMLQWLDQPLDVAERFADTLPEGGSLAIQVPDNYDNPSHRILGEMAASAPYAEHTAGLARDRGVDASRWLERLARPGWTVDAWETTYLHVLEGDDPVFTWISATGARPTLNALPDDLRERFVAEYKAALREAYPRQAFGTVLPFRRVFCVATRH